MVTSGNCKYLVPITTSVCKTYTHTHPVSSYYSLCLFIDTLIIMIRIIIIIIVYVLSVVLFTCKTISVQFCCWQNSDYDYQCTRQWQLTLSLPYIHNQFIHCYTRTTYMCDMWWYINIWFGNSEWWMKKSGWIHATGSFVIAGCSIVFIIIR